MTRGFLFVSTCLVLSLGAKQHALAETVPSVAWSRQIGTPGEDPSHSVAVDEAGNIYICGVTTGDLSGASAGGRDAFLIKFDPSGAELWSTQIGTEDWEDGFSVAVDSVGNAYISGSTTGHLAGINTGRRDAFLIKFNPLGTELWSRQIGSTRGAYDESYSVAVDSAGNAYITGTTNGALGGTNAGDYDAFLIKFGPSGNELWSKQIGSSDWDDSRSVRVDNAGNAYISGFTRGDLGGTNLGSSDAFLSKFDPIGNELWSTQFGTTAWDDSSSMAVDIAGNVYISGRTTGDLGGPNAGASDAFLTKFDPSGNELWSTQIGTTGGEESISVTVDTAGNVYITGRTEGNLGGTNAGDEDGFLTKFDPSGNELWSTQIGTENRDWSKSVAVDAVGNIYISGFTEGDLFGPNAGSSDAFLVKFAIPEPASLAVLVLGSSALLRCRSLRINRGLTGKPGVT